MQRVIALLDKPSAKSFGMVGIISLTEDGTYGVHGMASRSYSLSSEAALQELYDSGAVRDVRGCGANVAEPISPTTVAVWFGFEFLSACEALGAPRPETVEGWWQAESIGVFWLEPSMAAYARLLEWTNECAKLAFQRRDSDLADLMQWVLPTEWITMAAVWWTRPDEAARERCMQMWSQTSMPGRGSMSRETILSNIQGTLQICLGNKKGGC